MAVTSIVRDRGRAFVVAIAVAVSAAFLSAPAAFGAVDGDPIATSEFEFELSDGFKSKLQGNGVKMNGTVRVTKGDIDPTTGAGDLRLASIAFTKGGKKINFKNVKGSMPGKILSSKGKFLQLTAPTTVTRAGFGADLSGVTVKLLGSAAKQINKKLGLQSLHAGTVGSFSLAYQPRTVKILGGTAEVDGILGPGTVLGKMLGQHCAIPTPIAPATQVGLTLTFPVAGGTISPTGIEGIVQQQGGTRIHGTGAGDANCQGNPSALTQSGFAVNLALQNIQADVVLEKAAPGIFTGNRGIAITQLADPTGAFVILDTTNHTISVEGATIRINQVSADSLNLLFPQNPGGNPANDFASGDPFGTSFLTVTTR